MYFQNDSGPSAELRKMFIAGTYDTEFLDALSHMIRPGDHVIDVGAHEGFVSLVLAQKVGRTGSVLACEPNPENLRLLRLNSSLNQEAVRICEVAIGASIGKAVFHYNDSEGAWGSIIEYSHAHNQRALEIPVDTLDHLTANGPRIRLIKIDTEGFELEVLQGATSLIARDHPIVCFEINLTLWAVVGRSLNSLLDVFPPQGYRLYQLVGTTLVPFRWPDRRVDNVFAIHETDPLAPAVGR